MGQYFTNENLKSEIKELQVNIFNSNFCFYTDNGVFSKERLDFGTRVLLETLPVEKILGKVLDVGCGYGAISIILAKTTDCSIDGVDVNRRAIHLSKMNMQKNNANNIKFYESDCYEAVDDKYNLIITNPPIRAGKKTVYDIIIGAKDYLLKDGVLYFVIRKDHGMKSLLRDIEKYYNTQIIGKKNGFFVICCNLR
jgi:16S RNA G1207 methylase RsmC